MSNRRAHDLDETRLLCERLTDRSNSERFRDHLLACELAADVEAARRHLVIAFKIAVKEGAVTAGDWRAWKVDLARRRPRSKTSAGAAPRTNAERYAKGELGGLATERFRDPPSVRGR